MKYLKSFLLKDSSEQGGKVPAEVLSRKIERQGQYGWVLSPTEGIAAHLRTLSRRSASSPTGSCSPAFGRHKQQGSHWMCNKGSVQNKQLGLHMKLYHKQHEPLSAALSRLHVRQSNKLLSRQPTLLPVLLIEQLQQMSVVVLSRLYMPAIRPRQATSSARQTSGPAHFPEQALC